MKFLCYDQRNDKTENPKRPWYEMGSDGKYYYYRNFDWYNYFYQTTRYQQEHNFSVSGGNDKINYYASGNGIAMTLNKHQGSFVLAKGNCRIGKTT